MNGTNTCRKLQNWCLIARPVNRGRERLLAGGTQLIRLWLFLNAKSLGMECGNSLLTGIIRRCVRCLRQKTVSGRSGATVGSGASHWPGRLNRSRHPASSANHSPRHRCRFRSSRDVPEEFRSSVEYVQQRRFGLWAKVAPLQSGVSSEAIPPFGSQVRFPVRGWRGRKGVSLSRDD